MLVVLKQHVNKNSNSCEQLKSVNSKLKNILKLFMILQMKALQGLKLSYRLQKILQNLSQGIRGMRGPDDNVQSLNAYLYQVLRSNRSHRRAILSSLLNLFDDSAVSNMMIKTCKKCICTRLQKKHLKMFIIHIISCVRLRCIE